MADQAHLSKARKAPDYDSENPNDASGSVPKRAKATSAASSMVPVTTKIEIMRGGEVWYSSSLDLAFNDPVDLVVVATENSEFSVEFKCQIQCTTMQDSYTITVTGTSGSSEVLPHVEAGSIICFPVDGTVHWAVVYPRDLRAGNAKCGMDTLDQAEEVAECLVAQSCAGLPDHGQVQKLIAYVSQDEIKCITLADMLPVASHASDFKLIGIATTPSVITHPSGEDVHCSFKLIDPTCPDGEVDATLTGFLESGLPVVQRGSVVIIQRGYRRRTYHDVDRKFPKSYAVFGYPNSLSWAVLPVPALLAGTVAPNLTQKKPHTAFCAAEVAYAKDLALWWTQNENGDRGRNGGA
ncbi:hypothetical protein RQP46_002134 [Phenoliferia psychrophenolica]